MKATALSNAPEYFHQYINLAEERPLLDMLENDGINLYINQFKDLKAIGDKIYAPGKWTINEIVQHLIDTERIFINRALRFLRQDKTILPGYDQDAYVPVSRANEQPLEDLLEEYKALRKSTLLFFKPLTEKELACSGNANRLEISVLAIAYVLIGHPIHHFNVIRERYFVLD